MMQCLHVFVEVADGWAAHEASPVSEAAMRGCAKDRAGLATIFSQASSSDRVRARLSAHPRGDDMPLSGFSY